ncbi:capsule biosynthesis protein, partial [Campylobacter sp. BCW_8712]
MEEKKTLVEKIKDLSIFDSFKIVWFLMIFVVVYYVFIAAP